MHLETALFGLTTSPLAKWGLKPIVEIVTKPDNVPILIMIVLGGFFIWLSFYLALQNDRLKKESGDPKRDQFYPPEQAEYPVRIHVWPWLLRGEFICVIVVTLILMVWSIALDAPLEDPANANLTPNPSKAPWYFLGLQEMLVYFDPWIAGVVAPSLIVVGLMVIPYIDVNPKGNGYYTFRERPFAISVFMFGFMFWMLLIVIGTFMRGPGWIWFWPGQHWDPHAVVAATNLDFPDRFFGVPTKDAYGKLTVGHVVIGGLATAAYFVVMMAAPYFWLKKKKPEFLAQLGMPRYLLTAFLGAGMMGVVMKIVLRLAFVVKYVWVTPYARF